jgi:sugar phosphate isomerase/epimerase
MMKQAVLSTKVGAALDRRHFLKTVTAAAGACLLPISAQPRGAELAQRLHLGAQTNAWGVPIKDYNHLLEIAETLVRLGYGGFETNFASVRAQVGRAADCRRDFESRHIQFVAPHTGGLFYQKERVEKEIDQVQRMAGSCAQMGASHVIVSGEKLPHPDGKLDLDAVHIKADTLNRLGAAVKKDGVRLCYHNHETEFQDDPSEMSYLLRETDPNYVWLNLDVCHCYTWSDPVEFTAANFRRIAIFHLRDTTRKTAGDGDATKPGEGKIDLKGIVAPLLGSDWDGWLEVEDAPNYPKPDANPELVMQTWREYLRRLTGV